VLVLCSPARPLPGPLLTRAFAHLYMLTGMCSHHTPGSPSGPSGLLFRPSERSGDGGRVKTLVAIREDEGGRGVAQLSSKPPADQHRDPPRSWGSPHPWALALGPFSNLKPAF
jgi:hypothetical protein